MECYLCEEQKTIFCTSCCYRTCCKKCADDFGLSSECHCYNKVDSLVKCHQKPDNKLKSVKKVLTSVDKNGLIGLNQFKMLIGNLIFL